jgi:hypothetical protein
MQLKEVSAHNVDARKHQRRGEFVDFLADRSKKWARGDPMNAQIVRIGGARAFLTNMALWHLEGRLN